MTRRLTALIAAAVLGAVLVPDPAAAARQPAPAPAKAPAKTVTKVTTKSSARARAMWLWSAADPAAVVPWATAQGVKEIFVAVPWQPTAAQLARLKDLRTRTLAAGIRLSALGGDPSWALDPASAVAWRKRATATGLFDGIHLDVEPYLLPGWRTDQRRIVEGYLAMLDAVRAAGPEPLEADVPFWLATVPAGNGNLADAVIARVHAITVMSYRDSATGVIDVGADLLARAQSASRPARLAAETQPLADCAYCTFAASSRSGLAGQLSTVDAAAARFSSFNGVAVHDYDSWTRLR
ncbi:hypothetical protein ACFO1B_00300 [Dactylosporangium siamense]|uniref:Uncharacterized protein n=1 Tax=Dactylosporangium siamense TaxID=685454 RepID=A0A919PF26_9ACTN|nr:hypothetical protein [Dactylosporangium siamense]GIG42212.1 hypothetical protein Dsi01nite_002530 [Dactylosporangium siamense]